MKVDRRGFLSMSATAPATVMGLSSMTKAQLDFGTPKPGEPMAPKINFAYDGYMHTPDIYISVLNEIARQAPIVPDIHGSGGVVDEVVEKMKRWTGMEDAIYMPSGTMANNLAVRIISEDRPIIFVPERSHILHREADAAEVLHQKKMVPLAPGKAYYDPDEFERAVVEHKRNQRYGNDIGAATLEIAGRLVHQRTQPFEDMRAIAEIAKAHRIPLHLDGARIHSAKAYTGVSVAEYCALFDTVYMDLYKFFRAASGAVLCGPTSVISQMKRYIKMCGGSLIFNWPSAAVANYYMDGFEERFMEAQTVGLKMIEELNRSSNISIDSFDDGTNVFLLHFGGLDAHAFAEYLDQHHQILLRIDSYDADTNTIPFKLNETQLQVTPATIVEAFKQAEQYVA